MNNPDHIATVRAFFARWGTSYDELRASLVEGFAPAGKWIAGPGIPATTGGDQAAEVMDTLRASHDIDTIEIEIVKIAQSDHVVWTERVDYVKIAPAGAVAVSIPAVGVMTLTANGLISEWIDYWDRTEFDKLHPS